MNEWNWWITAGVVFAFWFIRFSVWLYNKVVDDPHDDWSKFSPSKKKPEPKKKVITEDRDAVSVSLSTMAERLKTENNEEKPHWPINNASR